MHHADSYCPSSNNQQMCVCVGLGFRDRAPRDPRKVLIETKMALDDEGLKSPLSVISVSQETKKKNMQRAVLVI